ncbi:SRPBCC family protein [Chloroflexota bacterium]
MARLEKEVILEAPIEDIYNYVSDPRNLPEFWPSVIDITDLKSLPNGGYIGRWTYKMAMAYFKGKGKYVKVAPNRLLVIETSGGIGSTITWTFRSRDNITRVTLTIEYKIPVPLLRKLAEAIIVKMNDEEGDLMMANLQARFVSILTPNVYSRDEYQNVRDELYKIAKEWFANEEMDNSLSDDDFRELAIKFTAPIVYNEFSVFASDMGRSNLYMTSDEIHAEIPLIYLDDTIKHMLEKEILIKKPNYKD